MNTNKFCPSCGEPVTPDMKSCPNCGENLVDDTLPQTTGNDDLKKAQTLSEETEAAKDGIQLGSRNNIVGDVTGRKIETQSMIENTNTHVEANTTNSVSTSHVDNSQKVINSNTNNVTYNIIYQNTGQGAAQQPNQGPGIPDFNPGQPFQPNPTPQAVSDSNASKGIGAIAGGQGNKPKTGNNTNGNMKTIIAACIGLVVVIGLFFIIKTPGDNSIPQEENAIPESVEKATGSSDTESSAADRPSISTEAAPEANEPAATKKQTKTPVEKATDSNYEKGMKAYKSGDALEAIKCFKSSGSAESNYMLGVIYEQGCGNVAANAMMARKYFKAAAKMGSEAAKAKL